MAARPKTLPAAFAPVVLGNAMAWHYCTIKQFNWLVFVTTVLATLLIQIGTNLANDVYDYMKGSDRADRLGPDRVTALGLLQPRQVKFGMIIVFCLALLIGIYLALLGGWPIVFIGSAAILSGIAYTGGPYPLAYNGLGDIFVFVFYGLVSLPGSYYLQTGNVSIETFLLGIGMGLMSANILAVNNIRDADQDRKSGKRTITVRFGRRFSRLQFSISYLYLYILPIFLHSRGYPIAVYLTYFSLPNTIPLIRDVWEKSGKPLNQTLANTGRHMSFYALLMSLTFIFW